ncbi:hypothetical protein VFPFJ_02456 [Purpureocillium lilacinum]|uniref:Uncharacterized protein n=1 Tax=Purpureocillium lilacinum TaxID=33203 RepID=A0A179HS47_PURLI|nr:hypothetical protein VFPFJ_02456 [Purpureocillium lilacinum]OAQ93295.1 hypothetical protein VFPFJ_02456 [Purpureocillium lilacinum]
MQSGTRWSTCPGFRRLRTVHELGNWQCPHSTLTSCRLSRHSRLRPSHPSTKSGYRELVWPLHGGRPSRRPNSGSLASPRRPLPPPSHPQDASSPKSKTRTQHLHTGTWPAKPNQTPPSYLGSRYSTLPSRPRHSSIHLPPILQLPDRYRVLAGRSRCQTRIGSTATLNSNDVGRPAGIVDIRDAPPQHQPFVRRAVRDALVLCRVVSSRNRRSVPPHQRCPVLCRPPRRLSSWSGHQQGSRHSHRQERRRVSWNAGSSVESRRERATTSSGRTYTEVYGSPARREAAVSSTAHVFPAPFARPSHANTVGSRSRPSDALTLALTRIHHQHHQHQHHQLTHPRCTAVSGLPAVKLPADAAHAHAPERPRASARLQQRRSIQLPHSLLAHPQQPRRSSAAQVAGPVLRKPVALPPWIITCDEYYLVPRLGPPVRPDLVSLPPPALPRTTKQNRRHPLHVGCALCHLAEPKEYIARKYLAAPLLALPVLVAHPVVFARHRRPGDCSKPAASFFVACCWPARRRTRRRSPKKKKKLAWLHDPRVAAEPHQPHAGELTARHSPPARLSAYLVARARAPVLHQSAAPPSHSCLPCLPRVHRLDTDSSLPPPSDHAAVAGRPRAGVRLLQLHPSAQRHAVSTSAAPSSCSRYLDPVLPPSVLALLALAGLLSWLALPGRPGPVTSCHPDACHSASMHYLMVASRRPPRSRRPELPEHPYAIVGLSCIARRRSLYLPLSSPSFAFTDRLSRMPSAAHPATVSVCAGVAAFPGAIP